MCVLKKVKKEEIEFEDHSTFMRCAHFRSLGTFSGAKVFLIKGFIGQLDRGMHTQIFCFWQYLKPPVRQVQETAMALRVQHGLYMAYTSLRIWRNLQGI